ncbi:MAG: 1-phosphofructokinase family hexose kinase, partial [Acidimicrobiales bacterium]
MTELIVTVTPSPSVDRTLEVTALERGEVNRATAARVDAGGKGVNVTRALTANGLPSLAVLPLGGPDGHALSRLLIAGDIPHRAVPIAAGTRTNVTLSEPGGRVTKINAPGAPLTAAELAALASAAVVAADGAGWLVLCGSLPPGAPDDYYVTLTERAHRAGVRVAVDTSGLPLAAALHGGPEVVKPNLFELAELCGRALDRVEDVIAAAEETRAAGAGAVVVSLGARGALLV